MMRLDKHATMTRLEKIESEMSIAQRNYEGHARSTPAHTLAWVRLHNLEAERTMLETLLSSAR